MATPNGTYYAEASATLGLWANINGTWTRVKQISVYGSGSYSNGGTKTLYWSISEAIQASGSVGNFRVTIDAVNSGSSAGISALSSVTWQTQSSSSSRSATPNGETVIATVRPQ